MQHRINFPTWNTTRLPSSQNHKTMWIIDSHNPLVLALTLTGRQLIPLPLVVQLLERKWRRQNGQVISDLPANSVDHTSFTASGAVIGCHKARSALPARFGCVSSLARAWRRMQVRLISISMPTVNIIEMRFSDR